MPRRAASFFSDDQDSSEPSQPVQTHNRASLKSSKKHKKYPKKEPSPPDKQNDGEGRQVSNPQIQQSIQMSEQDDGTKQSSVDDVNEVTKTGKSHKKEKHDADHSKKKKKHTKSVSKHSKHKNHAAEPTTATEATPKSQNEGERKHRHSHRSKDSVKQAHIPSKNHPTCPDRDSGHETHEQDVPKHSKKSVHAPTRKSSVRSESPPSRGVSQGSRSSYDTSTAVSQPTSERISEGVPRSEVSQPSRSRKHKPAKSSRSPSPVTTSHRSHRSEVSLSRPYANDYSPPDDKVLQSSVSYTRHSRSPVERSPPKIRRYDSHALSYGYRQEAHRQHSSTRYKSRSRYYRDRSRSPSSRRVSRPRTPIRHNEPEHSHSKSMAKPKSRTHVSNEDYESSRSSRKVHPSVVSKRPDEPTGKDSRAERISTSPSPRRRSRTEASRVQRNQDHVKHTSSSDSRGHSHSRPDSKRDKRTVDYNNTHPDSGPTEKSTTTHLMSNTEPVSGDSRSPSPKRKPEHKRKPESLDSLVSLLMELDTESVSDTELSTILPPALFASQTIQRDFDSKTNLLAQSPNITTSTAKDAVPINTNQNPTDVPKESDNFTTENNEATALETLDKVSSQVRKHLAEPETWDLGDLTIPYELDEDHDESVVNQSVVNLASRKNVPQQQQRLSNMLASICTPWQELIDSATKNLTSAVTKSESDSQSQPLGALLTSANTTFIPLHKRATGIEALRLTGISKEYLGQELIEELCAQHLDLTDFMSGDPSRMAWTHRSSMLQPCPSLELSQLCRNQSQDRIMFGDKFDLSIPFGAQLDLAIRRNLLGLTNG